MAKVFERFKDFINPNRKQDRDRKAREEARRAEEQKIAMVRAAEEAERRRNEAELQKKQEDK